jgi:hypothetical protein
MKRIIFTIIYLLPFFCYSQNIHGLVLDAETKEFLAYVNIGIKKKGVGTVSNIDGNFTLNISKEYHNDSICFSMIGYKSNNLIISKLQPKDTTLVLLTKKAYTLEEVEISAYKKHKSVGKTNHFNNAVIGFNKDNLGAEMGTLIKINKKKVKIENVSLFVFNCLTDSAKFRLNVYSYKNKLPNKVLTNNPIYFLVKKDDTGKEVIIDLSKENIVVNNDFVITIECLNVIGKEMVTFDATLFRGRFFEKKTSQDKWFTMPCKTLPIAAGMAINVEIGFK